MVVRIDIRADDFCESIETRKLWQEGEGTYDVGFIPQEE
jgi:hypothetical protein